MWDPEYLRERARQCEAMARIAVRTDLRDSLLQLAREFEEEAERTERDVPQSGKGLND